MATTGDEKERGINGGISKNQICLMNTIGVNSVAKFSKTIQDNGGKVLMPESTIPE